MKQISRLLAWTLCSIQLSGVGRALAGAPAVDDAAPGIPAIERVAVRLHGVSVPFVERDERDATGVRFAAQTFGATLAVTADGQIVYALPGRALTSAAAPTADAAPARRNELRPTGPGWTLIESFVGGRADPSAGVPHATRISRFIGNDPAAHQRNLRTYEHVALGEVFPGVQVRLRATGTNVEKIFTVAPGADPTRIALHVAGAESLRIGDAGALVIGTGNGEVAFTPPIAYQTIGGQQRLVDVRYTVDEHAQTYRFALGDYDAAEPLVIDPLLQATYLGGNFGDTIHRMVIHPASGEVLVAGLTSSTDLQCTTAGGSCAAGAQTAHASDSNNSDGFVARLSADLTQLKQATYLGGNGFDSISSMVIDPVSGDVLVAGATRSTNLACTTAGGSCAAGAQSAHAIDSNKLDGFIARLSADLTQLKQATYLGGTGDDTITDIVIHPASGEVLVAGETSSTNFPCTTAGGGCAAGAQSAHAADSSTNDGFVARLSADLTQLKQATYLGGNASDVINAIAIHPTTGEVVVAGITLSTNLPCTTAGAVCATGAQSASAGLQDGFVARLSADLTQLKQATYLGGNGNDAINAMAIHPRSGEVVVAGSTTSTNLACTTASGGCAAGAQTAHASDSGINDGFVARLSADLTHLNQATYLGGNGGDSIGALAIHPLTGDVFVAGSTISTNLACTTAGGGCAAGAQSAHASDSGSDDGFVARLSADLTQLKQATYLGGNDLDTIGAMVIHSLSGELLVAGSTYSTNFPCTTAGGGCAAGAQSAHASDTGNNDGFIARLTPDLALPDLMPDSFAFARKSGVAPLSMQTSAPVKITGLGVSAAISISGRLDATYCVNSTASCATCDVSGTFVSNPGSIGNNNFVCARHTAPAAQNAENFSVVQIGASGARFYVSTGTPFANCSLDVDGNGVIEPLSDGLILMRAMLGMTGNAVTQNALGSGTPTRNTWQLIQQFLNGNCGTNFLP